MRLFRVCFLSLLIVFPSFLSGEGLFAPFVSRIRISVTTSSVRLIWKDSKDIEGKYSIYLSEEEITKENFGKAVKIGEVETGKEFFIHYPKTDKKYYYLVLGSKKDGGMYEIFVPFRNLTTMGVAIGSPIIAGDESESFRIYGIKAIVDGDAVALDFKSVGHTGEIYVYRGIKPIKSSDDVKNANRITTLPASSTGYKDYPVPGVEYYYGVLEGGEPPEKASVSPGENTTLKPVRLPLGIGRIGLPGAETYGKPSAQKGDIKLSRSITLPGQKELAYETKKAIEKILRREKYTVRTKPLKPVVLGIDQTASFEKEEHSLRAILDNEFKEENWIEAVRLLTGLLSLKQPENLEKRLHFYLGQAYYFSNNRKKAYIEFIFSNDFYSLSKPFQDDILRKFSRKTQGT